MESDTTPVQPPEERADGEPRDAPRRRLPRWASASNLMSATALFVALGGTAYASGVLPRDSVGSAQIRSRAVHGKNVAQDAITTSKVKDGSLQARDFRAGELPAGERGPAGPKGDDAPAGAKGPAGEQGPVGAAGPKGPDGSKGPDGDPGGKGEAGDKGPEGTKGQNGDPGAKGPSGDAGGKGPTGDKGPNGDAGAKGPDGSKGPDGNKGPNGDKGPTGDQGPAGDPGSSLSATSAFAANTPSLALTDAPTTSTTERAGDAIVSLPANATVGLELFGLLGAVTLQASSAGAALTVQRLS